MTTAQEILGIAAALESGECPPTLAVSRLRELARKIDPQPECRQRQTRVVPVRSGGVGRNALSVPPAHKAERKKRVAVAGDIPDYAGFFDQYIWKPYPRKDYSKAKAAGAISKIPIEEWREFLASLYRWLMHWQALDAEGQGKYVNRLDTFIASGKWRTPPPKRLGTEGTSAPRTGAPSALVVKVSAPEIIVLTDEKTVLLENSRKAFKNLLEEFGQ